MYVPAQYFYHPWRPPLQKGLPYKVNEMTHEQFFYLKELSGSLGSNFSKTTENETVKMTDIKTAKVDKRIP